VFDPSDDGVFVCGNMDRSVEVFDAASGDKLASLSSEWLTAVPTLNAIHPSLDRRLILSGTASGRLHLWS
jgi:WD40 repeat protein